MEVTCETLKDQGEQDEHGHYDFHYSGRLFTFRDGQATYLVRQYSDEPEEAHFLSDLSTGHRSLFKSIPYDQSLFRLAAKYLLKEAGVSRLQILLPHGYTDIDLAQLGL